MKKRINRDLSIEENYSGREIKKGEEVFLFYGCTYGCIAPGGIAVSFVEDQPPFFEVPEDAIESNS
jgi:hypothetical protein